jgi:hypothetical protein
MIQIKRDFENISEFHWNKVKSSIEKSIDDEIKKNKVLNEKMFLRYIQDNFLKDDDNNLIKAKPEKLIEISELIFEETKTHFKNLLVFEFAIRFDKFPELIETDEKLDFLLDFLDKYDRRTLVDISTLKGIKDGREINSSIKKITGTKIKITKDYYSGAKLKNLLSQCRNNIVFVLDVQKLVDFKSYFSLSKSKRKTKFNKDFELKHIKNPLLGLGEFIYSKDTVLLIEKIFNYTKFSNKIGFSNGYNAYDLAKELKINVCPYCNINDTKTVINDKVKISRPDFDHFLEKKRHPFFRLSFWNLIPSCKVCNSTLKNQKETTLNKHLHPYLGGFSNDVIFKSSFKSVGNYQVDFDILPTMSKKGKDRVLGNIAMFKLHEIYNDHDDLIDEIMWKKVIYNHSFYNTISKEFKDLFDDEVEYYRYAFGNYYDEEGFEKRPFAKMTKDLFDDDTFYELDLTELEKKLFEK